jgi:hypothetical protein
MLPRRQSRIRLVARPAEWIRAPDHSRCCRVFGNRSRRARESGAAWGSPKVNALFSSALLLLPSGLACLPGIQQRRLKLPLPGSLCLSRGMACGEFGLTGRFPLNAFSLKSRFTSGQFRRFLGGSFRGLLCFPRFLGGFAYSGPGLAGSDDGSPSRLALGKSRIVQLRPVPFESLLLRLCRGLLTISYAW